MSRAIFLGEDSSNNIAATSNVAANEDGSVLERLEQIQEAVNTGTGTSLSANTSLADILYAANGISTFPAAAAPADAVSIAEVLRSIYNRISYDSAASVVTTNPRLGTRVSKTGDSGANTREDLFTVTGKVLITLLTGEVSEVIETTTSLSLNSSTNDLVVGASTTITADAVGTMYVAEFDGTALLGGVTANIDGVLATAAMGPFIMNDDRIEYNVDASGATGQILWELWYVPLEASATVAAS